ncbi:bacterial ammonia monooxygenase, subunit AmoB [Methylobacter luteus]|uniref:bacterial ammonia monooxygenase, subunit AmoB n=1 Tax=Methylobacter luteus TaxID=415 RepID=UPI0003FCDDAF|nr:bacterial ammonia monooxygenase, subunit AmoB [Methylobacter luteus]
MKSLFKPWVLALVWLSALSVLQMPTAQAHGEKALEPFIRMRTIQWYDVQWSTQKFNVNDEVSVSGKFHVAEDWPISVPKPEASFLNISTPGPVLIRTERYLNGKPWVNSVALQPGGDYEFKVVLKGRLPGRYHIHPFFNLKDAGQVMGPGAWLEIGGAASDFSNTIKTISGEAIDMESFGLSNGIFWHLFWGFLAAAWLIWWVRRPLFISRYRMLEAGLEHELVTKNDKLIAKLILAGVPVLVLILNEITAKRYPDAIPLQAGLDQILPLPAQVNAGTVNVDTLKAEYNVAQRSMVLQVKVDNRSQSPVRIGEFSTSNVHFLNPALSLSGVMTGDDDITSPGLSIDDDKPIEPGEQRVVTLVARDAAWESEKLDGLIRDADSRIGGLLFLYDELLGQRYISSISAAVIPKFS